VLLSAGRAVALCCPELPRAALDCRAATVNGGVGKKRRLHPRPRGWSRTRAREQHDLERGRARPLSSHRSDREVGNVASARLSSERLPCARQRSREARRGLSEPAAPARSPLINGERGGGRRRQGRVARAPHWPGGAGQSKPRRRHPRARFRIDAPPPSRSSSATRDIGAARHPPPDDAPSP
jgi:hypothetical protein